MHPILFRLGPITVFTYGACVALGFVLGTWLAARRARQCDVSAQRLVDIVVFSLLVGLVGARATYVLNHWQFFSEHPLEIVFVHHGGLVFYGGLLVALAFGAWLLQRASLPVWVALDIIAPSAALGHAIGRIGCFFNGCCFGRATDSWMGWSFPALGWVYPTQLFSSLMLLGIFVVLCARWDAVYRGSSDSLETVRLPGRSGLVFLTYLWLYGMGRFLMEYVRGDTPLMAGGLKFSQWASVGLLLVAAVLTWWNCRDNISAS